MKKGDNDNVRLLEIKGASQQGNLHEALLEMSITSLLTKTDKGLYHVQICPAYGEDRLMTDEDWIRAADIMEEETGFSGQKRTIILHDKKSKNHAHVVWERYDHENAIMIPNKFSRLAQDRARIRMEMELEHNRTPLRNPHRPEMKKYLTEVWNKTHNGESFTKVIAENGYIISEGTKRPYMVVDETGRSFDLVRQLDKVKTKEVRERFKDTKLITEKEAITRVRARQKTDKKKIGQKLTIKRETLKEIANDNIKQIEQVTPPKAKRYSMSMNFTMKLSEQDVNFIQENTLNKAMTKEERKAVEKQKALDKLKAERLQKAKEFRENERDL